MKGKAITLEQITPYTFLEYVLIGQGRENGEITDRENKWIRIYCSLNKIILGINIWIDT